MISRRALQGALVAACVATLVVLFGLFATGFRILCLGVVVAVAAVAFPESRREGGGWWWILAAGTALSIAGAVIAQPSPTLGGVVALLAGFGVLIAAVIGFPGSEEE